MKITLEERMEQFEQKKALKESKEKCIKAYRDYARIDDKTKITEENLNYEALDRVARNFAFERDALKETLLKEETIQ